MKPNPFSNLVGSRRFWLMLLDVIVSVALHFAMLYLDPAHLRDIQFTIAALQPVIIFLIKALTDEDAAAIKAGVHPAYPPK